MKTKHIILILLPAILIVAFALFIRLSQYEPLYPNYDKIRKEQENITALDFIPILEGDPIIGNKKAIKTIIAFEDLGCERCREQMTSFNELIQTYPNLVKIIWKGLSVTKFPYSSETAHQYAYCANLQGRFTEFENQLLAIDSIDPNSLLQIAKSANLDGAELSACLASADYANYKQKTEDLARSLGITSVPTVFIDNQVISDPLTLDGWKTILAIP